MNKSVTAVALVVFIAVAAAGGYWFGAQQTSGTANRGPGPGEAPRNAAGPAAVTVEAVPVATLPMPQTITAVGSLRSDESVTLRPEVAGRIATIHFQEGQRVAKGAPLIRLDPAINSAEVQQARANLQ